MTTKTHAKTRTLVEGALMIALGTVLSYIPIYELPHGGSVTFVSCLLYTSHIPEADIPKLFEPFYRVEQSRNRQTGGSGLGLSIVKTILDLHGAGISIRNTKDGVIVDVTL